MKNLLQQLNQMFENRVRLAIMSILVVNDGMDFNSLKSTLGLTDGNLASHVATLEKHHYVSVTKKFVGKKPLTTYAATSPGRKALSEHLDALEEIIRQTQ